MNIKHLALFLGASIALTGCTGSNLGVESARQPVVARTNYVFDLANAGSVVDTNDAARLSGWLDSLNVGYGDHISVDTNGAYDTSGAMDVVGSIVARRGLLLDRSAPITSGEIPSGSVRVIVTRMTAEVPGCEKWDQHSQWTFEEKTSENYGCAINQNLAAMVADPEDLVSGRQGDSTINASASSGIIQANNSKRKASGGRN
jgi:pilus assembly protein CpaD